VSAAHTWRSPDFEAHATEVVAADPWAANEVAAMTTTNAIANGTLDRRSK
jgi:hypothetical protein